MASKQPVVITTGVNEVDEASEEIIWKICNFRQIVDDEHLLQLQMFQYEMKENPDITYCWRFSLSKDKFSYILIKWMLHEVKGNAGSIVKARLDYKWNKSNNETAKFTACKNFTESTSSTLLAIFDTSDIKKRVVKLQGEDLVLNLKLTILRHFNGGKIIEKQLERETQPEFLPQSVILKNFQSLLSDKESSDVKIVTSDNKTLCAHKLILKAQNPVFASMLCSDFSESKTGVINVDDVCGKTMEIILLYLYTGELLRSWSDADVVVEFIYAAGKYQLTEVLQMLDDKLLKNTAKDYSSCYMSLLSLTSKLSLKRAEARLLKRISEFTADVKTAEELLAVMTEKT